MLTLTPEQRKPFTRTMLLTLLNAKRQNAALGREIEQWEHCAGRCDDLMAENAKIDSKLDWLINNFFPPEMLADEQIRKVTGGASPVKLALEGVIDESERQEFGNWERQLHALCPMIDRLSDGKFPCRDIIDDHKQLTENMRRLRSVLMEKAKGSNA